EERDPGGDRFLAEARVLDHGFPAVLAERTLHRRRRAGFVLEKEDDRGAVVVEQDQVLSSVAVDVRGTERANVPVELGDLGTAERRHLAGARRCDRAEHGACGDRQVPELHGFGGSVFTTARRLELSMTTKLQLLPKYLANTSGDGVCAGSVYRASDRTS